MDNLNDIISSLTADDINMLKGVASSILGEDNENDNSNNNSNNNTNSNNKNSNYNNQNNNNNLNNNSQINNNMQLNNLQNSLNNILGNSQGNSQNLNGLNPNSLGINADDFKMMMKAKTIFDKMNNTSDKNTDLILALKPHLSPESRNKADIAIKILRLFDILPLLKDLF